MPLPNTCSRCGAADAGAFCARCGAPVDDAVAALRQETYLAFVIEDVLASRDPVLALQRWQAQSATRRRLLSAGVPDPTPATATATATTDEAPAPDATGAPPADAGVAREAATENTPVDTAADGAKASTTTSPTSTTASPRPGPPPRRPVSPPRPTPAARPQRPTRPTPRPLTPAEARARFEQRLEIGGWFTGALFAVGGSLWATNLFWDDIPATLRPAVVGAGLAAFAAAFMALGAVLAARHRDSLAGHVLGVVGRLIGVSATIPLALLRRENLPLALVTDVVVMGSLWWAMRFAHRRSDTATAMGTTSDAVPWSGARWFLVGFGLAVVGPTSPWLGIPVAIAALLMTRAAIADGTLPALAGQRTWVDDLSILAVGAAALTSSLLGIRDAMTGAVHGALWSIAIVAALELVLRLIEQRQSLYGLRGVSRWLLALWSLGTAFNVVSNAGDTGPLLPAVALLFVAASFHDPERLSLPPLVRLVGVVATALAAGFLTRFVPWVGSAADGLFLTTTLVVILALTHRERRLTTTGGHQVASLLLWLSCSGTALAFADDGLVAVPALMAAAALWLTDRRAERSGAFNLLTVAAVMAPVLVVADDLLPRAWRSVADVSVLCALGLGLAVARRVRPGWPLVAGTTATSTWIAVVGIGASIAAADREPAFIAAIIIACTLWALVELSRHVELGVVAAGILWAVAAIALRDPLGVTSLRTTMPLAALVLAAFAFAPRIPGVAGVRLLLPAWSHGRARHARPWSLVAVGSVVVAALMILRLPMMPTETGLLQAATSPALGLAALLFALRHPSRRQWALFLASTAQAHGVQAVGAVAGGLTTFSSQTPGFSVSSFNIANLGNRVIAPLDSGPFQGMIAMQDTVDLRLGAQKNGAGWKCDVTQELSLGKIGLFQFAVFSGIPIELFNPPTMDIRGPVHINGDFCAGGGAFSLTIEKITVSGRLRSGCNGGNVSVVPSGSLSTNGFNIRDRVGDTPRTIDNTNDGASTGWTTNAVTRWNGNALDQSQSVPVLRLPVATAASAQPGNDQEGDALTNFETLRLVVDPPRNTDTPGVAAERFYNKADIRIINGVWYRRDGTVLWSDHTAGVTLAEQASLAVPNIIPAPPTGPKRYSYYERDGTGVVANGTARSIVSFGALFRTSATDWRPGFVNAAGTAVVQATTNAEFVEGTRSGFVDRRVALASGEPAGRILPLNFDVAAFVEALNDTASGELGDAFPGGSFNGIVWIGNTWPDHDRGFTTNTSSGVFAAAAPVPPLVGGGNRNQLPPLPLCRATAGTPALSGSINQVACNDGNLPRINAVRVHNASAIDPSVLPRGLTIVSNGPMYVLGDVNTSSLVAGTPPAPGVPRMNNPAGPWVPVLLAGDAVTLLSTAWRDHVGDRAFGVAPVQFNTGCSDAAKPASIIASPTTVVAAILAGQVESGATHGGGINNFPRFLECWTNVDNRIIGSLVIGFRSVSQRSRFHLFAYRPPNRLWSFDTNFANPAQQPPGTPLFDVQSTRRWKR